MSDSRVELYRNGSYSVTGKPEKSGTISVEVRESGWDVTYDRVGRTWVRCNGLQRVWWKPWTWGNLTVHEGLQEMVEKCDRLAQAEAVGQMRLRDAQEMLTGLQERTEALEILEAELAR